MADIPKTFVIMVILGCAAAISSDEDFFGISTQQPEKISYTFGDRAGCNEVCAHLCTTTFVYYEHKNLEMYNCVKMKPPKASVINSLRSNSLYMTLVVLAAMTLGVIVLMSIVFLCSMVCNQRGISNRNVDQRYSKCDAAEGEFREYLHHKTEDAEKRTPKTAEKDLIQEV
ncbi:unnamed protein product [Caenorhabditis auriculariae]|uniref:Uncharacterized protein n=1 Tax=Caenorhabditis auriculariae TaxID=2777116 RepID=A0A8S1H131_9PELO|nr:unnamed protein product [Caenorhabditis auriculariae]